MNEEYDYESLLSEYGYAWLGRVRYRLRQRCVPMCDNDSHDSVHIT